MTTPTASGTATTRGATPFIKVIAMAARFGRGRSNSDASKSTEVTAETSSCNSSIVSAKKENTSPPKGRAGTPQRNDHHGELLRISNVQPSSRYLIPQEVDIPVPESVSSKSVWQGMLTIEHFFYLNDIVCGGQTGYPSSPSSGTRGSHPSEHEKHIFQSCPFEEDYFMEHDASQDIDDNDGMNSIMTDHYQTFITDGYGHLSMSM